MTPSQESIALSVVIVSWNTRDLVERCLRSICADLRRCHIASEIIVVDNASSDGTPELIRKQFPGVTLIALDRNTGFTAANNLGLRHTTGKAILLLNPDTEIRPGAIATMLATLSATPHVGMVSGLLLNPDGSLQSSGYRFPGLAQSFLDFFPLHPRLTGSSLNGRVSPGDLQTPYAVDHPLGACMLVRREVVEHVGLLDESYFMYSEEIDWCRRIRAAGWTVLIAPSANVVHFGGQSTRLMPEEMFLQLHQSRAHYLRRYNGPSTVLAVAVIARLAALRAGKRARVGRKRLQHDASALRAVASIYRRAVTGGD